MKSKNAESAAPSPHVPGIRIVSGQELGAFEESIRRAIAYRAYELFDARGRNHGQALEDWLHAERELRRPANIEISETAAEVSVRAGIPGFGPGDLQAGLAPRRLILWGQLRPDAQQTGKGTVQMLGEIDLPARVDPTQARASLSDGIFDFVAAKEKTRGG
ncbi:MAG: DUF2934 domain-containing protein [Terriglobia bacterium]